MVVAFVEIESPQSRIWRQCASGVVTDDDLAGRRARLDRYWCAPDKPLEDDGFRLAPVYRTNEVPEDASCEECGIGIKELQVELSRSLRVEK